MSDAAVATTPAAKKTGETKKTATKSTHPPASEMVNAAIAALKDKKGSSLRAIKKYVALTYSVDPDKQSTFIKKYLRAAVEKKMIVQTKGTGATGRFKLNPVKAEGEKKKKVAAKKPAAEKKLKAKKSTAIKIKPVAKKDSAGKKTTKKAAAKPKVEKATKAPSKAKKSGKASAAKPRTPKPKKATVPKTKPTAKN